MTVAFLSRLWTPGRWPILRYPWVPPPPPPPRFAVFSFGHAGSLWLSQVLTDPERGIATFQEPVLRMLGPALEAEPWMLRLSQQPPRDRLRAVLEPYVEWTRHRERQFRVFGEVHNNHLLHVVPQLLPGRRLLLVRHPVRSVHGMTLDVIRNQPWRIPWMLDGAPLAEQSEQVFAAVCHHWNNHLGIYRQVADGRVVRLEDLVDEEGLLERMHAELTGEALDVARAAAARRHVVNRKTLGNSSPANLYWRGVVGGDAQDIFGGLRGGHAFARLQDYRAAG